MITAGLKRGVALRRGVTGTAVLAFLTVLSTLIVPAPACAQDQASPPSTERATQTASGDSQAAPSPRHLLPIPAEENWSFLADPAQRTDPLDGLKYIPIGPSGGYLSFGGEARTYYESFRNEGLGRYPETSGYLKQRYLLHADYHPTSNWRVFLEFQNGEIGSRPGGPRPTVDEKRADLLEGFLEWTSTGFDAARLGPDLTLRVGRQELDFGAGRLISGREGLLGEGPNVLQGFDGVRGILRDGPWRLDLFGALPVENKITAFTDSPFPKQAVWGAYLNHGGSPGAPGPGFDLYYIGTERPDAAFYSGSGYERRHTVGARAYMTGGPYDYDAEAFYQFGTIGSRDIEAWSISAKAGYTFDNVLWTPRMGVGLAANSGGGNTSTDRDAYAPFPRGAYFGFLSPIGPTNTSAAQASLKLHPTRNITMGADVYFYWRTDTNDGLYALAGYPLVAPNNGARYVGYQPGLNASWQVTSHLTLNAAYEILERGDFLKASPGTKPVNYLAAWATFRF